MSGTGLQQNTEVFESGYVDDLNVSNTIYYQGELLDPLLAGKVSALETDVDNLQTAETEMKGTGWTNAYSIKGNYDLIQAIDVSGKVNKSGDTMTGALTFDVGNYIGRITTTDYGLSLQSDDGAGGSINERIRLGNNYINMYNAIYANYDYIVNVAGRGFIFDNTNSSATKLYYDTAAIGGGLKFGSLNISNFDNRISVNEGAITTNTSNISTNSSDITTIKGSGWTNQTIKQNADDIASNTSSISTNSSNISTNTTNITANSSDITTIKGTGWTNQTIKGNYDLIQAIDTSDFLNKTGDTMTGDLKFNSSSDAIIGTGFLDILSDGTAINAGYIRVGQSFVNITDAGLAITDSVGIQLQNRTSSTETDPLKIFLYDDRLYRGGSKLLENSDLSEYISRSTSGTTANIGFLSPNTGRGVRIEAHNAFTNNSMTCSIKATGGTGGIELCHNNQNTGGFRIETTGNDDVFNCAPTNWTTGRNVLVGAVSNGKYMEHSYTNGTSIIDNDQIRCFTDGNEVVLIQNDGDSNFSSGDFIIKQQRRSSGTIYNQASGGLRLYNSTTNTTWAIFTNDAYDLNFNVNGNNKSFINDTGQDNQLNGSYTIQHRNHILSEDYKKLKVGMILCSTGKIENFMVSPLNAPTINEALPILRLSNKKKEKCVFGVYSNSKNIDKWISGVWATEFKDDIKSKKKFSWVNSGGEGAILVNKENGVIENGDFIMTSSKAGIGCKSDNVCFTNYTIAKATQNLSDGIMNADGTYLISCLYML